MSEHKNPSIDEYGEVTPELDEYMRQLIAEKRRNGFPFSYADGSRLIREYPNGDKFLIKRDSEGNLIEVPVEK